MNWLLIGELVASALVTVLPQFFQGLPQPYATMVSAIIAGIVAGIQRAKQPATVTGK